VKFVTNFSFSAHKVSLETAEGGADGLSQRFPDRLVACLRATDTACPERVEGYCLERFSTLIAMSVIFLFCHELHEFSLSFLCHELHEFYEFFLPFSCQFV